MKELITYQNYSLDQPELLQKVIAQFNKDLGMVGMNVKFSETSSIHDFLKDINNWSVEVLEGNDPNLMNLLYRIDVNQNKIFTHEGNPHENLVVQILKRELQKVILRQQFSSGTEGNGLLD